MTAVELTVQVLTSSALIGLLGAVGLRLTYAEVQAALNRCRLFAILGLNFVVIPMLAIIATRAFNLNATVATGMVLLAAAPFAPVVPVFARMARADLPLAAALTGIMPLISALLAPFVARICVALIDRGLSVRFEFWVSLVTLMATITLPLVAGVIVSQRLPNLGQYLLRPVEVISEAIGAVSLAFVTVTQFKLILDLHWAAWIAMAMLSELSLFLGWQIGGPNRASRQAVALGTSNRNIALALLIAIQSFHGTAVASVVVANGLLLIAFGLLHVAWWRFGPGRSPPLSGRTLDLISDSRSSP